MLPFAEELGLSVWDVRYVREGGAWYLRIFIDKPGGVGIEDCEKMSRAINGPLDELDPDPGILLSGSFFAGREPRADPAGAF